MGWYMPDVGDIVVATVLTGVVCLIVWAYWFRW